MAGFRSLSKPLFLLLAIIVVTTLYSLQSSYSLPSAVDLQKIKPHVPESIGKIAGAMAESTPNPPAAAFSSKLVHVVMFEFNKEAEKSQVKLLVDKMLGLKHKCIHPTTKKHYVKSMIGGKENSPEGMQKGITHVFIAEFDNAEDRKYYLEKDPAHLSFVESLKGSGHLVNATVVDFTPGLF